MRLQEEGEASVGRQGKIIGHRVTGNPGKIQQGGVERVADGIDRNVRLKLKFMPDVHHGVRSELVHRDVVAKRGDVRSRQVGEIAVNDERAAGEIQIGSPRR